MRSITRLFGAFGTLADSLLSLAAVVNTTTDKLRLQLTQETEPVATLPHNGEVIDQQENGTDKSKRRKVS